MIPRYGLRLANAGSFVRPDETPIPVTPGAWAIETAYEDKGYIQLSSSTLDSNITAIRFKPDGTRMFLLGAGNKRIYQLELSTPWEISTAIYGGVYANIATYDSNPLGFDFRSNGTALVVVGASNKRVHFYTLGTAWDISTLSTTLTNYRNYSDDGFAGSIFTGVRAASTNNKLFFTAGNTGSSNNDRVRWCTTTNAFSSSYALTVQTYAYVFGTFTNPTDIDFSADGTKFFVVSQVKKAVAAYSLATAWSLATGAQTYLGQKSVSDNDSYPTSICISADGKKFYVTGSANKNIGQYNMATAYDINTASVAPPMPLTSVETQPTGIEVSSNGSYIYIIGTVRNTIDVYQMVKPFILNGATLLSTWSETFSYAVQSFRISFDGTKLFTLDSTSKSIKRYTLSTAYRPSTANITEDISLDITSYIGTSTPTGLCINKNGTHLFVSTNDNKIHIFVLPVPFSLSSVTYNSYYSVAGAVTCSDVCCDSSGKHLVYTDNGNGTMKAIWFSILGDPNSVTSSGSYTVDEETQPSGLALTPDGKHYYVTGSIKGNIRGYFNEINYSTGTQIDFSSIKHEPGYSAITARQILNTYIDDLNKPWTVIGDETTTNDVFVFDGAHTFYRKSLTVNQELGSISTSIVKTFTHPNIADPIEFARVGAKGTFILTKTQNGIWAVDQNSTAKYEKTNLPANISIKGFYIRPSNARVYRLQHNNDLDEYRIISTQTPNNSAYTAATVISIMEHPIVLNALINISGYIPEDFSIAPDGSKLILQVKNISTGAIVLNSYNMSTAWNFTTINFTTPNAVLEITGLGPCHMFIPNHGKHLYVKPSNRDYKKYTILE